MKLKSFAEKLASIAESLAAFGADRASARVASVANVLGQGPNKTLDSVLSNLSLSGDFLASHAPPHLFELKSDLSAIALATDKIATKAFADDLNLLLRFCSKHPGMSLESLLRSLESAFSSGQERGWKLSIDDGEDKAAAYARSLQDAVHDAALFPKIYAALKADASMKKPDVVRIANQIVFRMPAKTTKAEALDRIWARHKTSEATGKKTRSMGGRSAA